MSIHDRPKGRSARTPPPTLLFSLHLSKNTPSHRDEKRTSSTRRSHQEQPGPEAPWQPVRKNRAADEDDLSEPLPKVNIFFEDFFSKSMPQPSDLVFRQASALAKAYSPLRLHHPHRWSRCGCFLMSSEEPWRLAL